MKSVSPWAILVLIGLAACSGDLAEEGTAEGIDASDAGADGDGAVDGGEHPEVDVAPSACGPGEQGASCDDGNPCTVDDLCDQGLCVGSANLPCDDAGACQPGSCVAGIGCVYEEAEDGTSCSVACFGEATCDGGACVPDAESAVECPETFEPCVNQLACASETGECTVRIYEAEGSSCNMDDDVCSFETCDADGACVATGETEDCASKHVDNPCWTWACTSKTGCIQTSFVSGVSCSDKNPCTHNDICALDGLGQETCVGTPVGTDDGNPCTDDACVAGEITHTPLTGATCDAEGPCATSGECEGAVCKPVGFCACAVDADCAQPENPCLGAAICDTTGVTPQCAIVPGSAVVCEVSDDPCAAKKCNPGTGVCETVWTVDSMPCDDEDACTVGDHCLQGACAPGFAVNCLDTNPCTDDTCDASTGCVHEENTAPCEDGSICTAGDTCLGGGCIPGAAIGCDDLNPCTDDSCDNESGCVHTANTVPCEDGNACSDNDACSVGACLGGPPAGCDDLNPCTDDGCDLVLGCVHVNNLSACDDDDACTVVDACVAGACVGSGLLSCQDVDPCTTDGCNAQTGCTFSPFDGPCDDGDPCTTGDLCQVGFCVPGGPTDCDDQNPCTSDSCVPGEGCVYEGAPLEVCDGLDNDCDGEADEDDACPPGITVTGLVPCDAVWTAEASPYHVTGNLLVQPDCTLTLEPGTVLKFAVTPSQWDRLYMKVSGTLVAVGTEDQPIILTAEGTNPSKEQWGGVWLQGPGTTMSHVHFYYGGGDQDGEDTALAIQSAGHALDHGRFFHTGDAIRVLAGGGGYEVTETRFEHVSRGVFLFHASAGVTITHNDFYEASTPLYVTSGYSGSSILFAHNHVDGGDDWRCDGPTGGDFIVTENVFENVKIWLFSGCAPSLTNNDILGPNNPRLVLQGFNGDGLDPPILDATGNYWGEEATDQMETSGPDANIAAIEDYYDDFTLGKVDYSGWLAAPVPGAGP